MWLHGRGLFRISWGAHVCVTNSPGRGSQRIQNAADNKETTLKTQGTNRVELQCVSTPQLLLNSEYILIQNKTDHTELNPFRYYE